ncbi:MAG: Do family serine endopeptidase [Spirochaetia bacterium]|nr:Do family serine endopeptidase [Spirochaetota bacterium]MCX8096768.1 Do family serine endopeptidase [Spirochaetota bacterium]MDW8112542.1 Do family serine endopeptidase [Spirochaetia bacterium]
MKKFFYRFMRNWFVLNLLLTGFLFGVIFSFGVLGGSCSTKSDFLGNNISFASGVDLSKLSEEYKYAYAVQKVLNEVAEKVSPVVVNIKSEDVVEYTYRDPFQYFFDDEFFKRFFDIPEGPKERKYKRVIPSLGSGFIISKDGYILSNLHVLRPAGKVAKNIVVTVLKSGREYKARVIGYDEETDIALLKIDPKEELPVANLGDSDKVKVGDFAIAVGNPFGLTGTFTFGTVSAINRDIQGNVFSKYIQTDAPINPGNSGGPLVNIFGEVIGINTMIISPNQFGGTAGNVGIGLAIPINTAKRVVKQLIDKGKVERGYIGVSISELDEETRKQMGLPKDVGVLVSKVEPGSPAEKEGVKQGDVIVEVDGQKISTFSELLDKIASKSPGDNARIKVFRDGRYIDFNIRVASRPTSEELAKRRDEGELKPLTRSEYKGIVVSNNPNGDGVVVVEVKDDSPFSGIIQKGDIIIEINNQKINNISDFEKFSKANQDQKRFLMKFYRNGMLMIRGFTIR